MSNDPLGLFEEEHDPLGLFGDDKPKEHKVLSADLPLGILETATTGMIDPMLGLGASLGGAARGLVDGKTAGEGWERGSKWWEDSAAHKVLAPQTESGKAIGESIGSAVQGIKDDAALFAEQARPDAPEGIKTARRAMAAVFSASPEIAMALSFKGAKRPSFEKEVVPKIEPKVEAPAADPLGLFDAAKEQKIQDLAALGDEHGQMSLFDQGDQMGQRNQFNAGDLGDWRIDENGMPVRIDKSMEAANVEAPLQKNLWGDELGPSQGQDFSLTQSIDNTPKNGQWAQRRGMTNRLGGDAKEVVAGNDLLAAVQEANGPKLPFEEQTTFQPKNPLPTMTERESQTGAKGVEPLPPGDRPIPTDSVETPRSPETIAKAAEMQRAAERMPAVKGLEEFDAVKTPEQAKSMALENGMKDDAPGFVGRNAGSGANWAAAMTNNPLIKYANTVFRDARTNADRFSRENITSKDGLSPVWSKMNDVERSAVREALMDGDKHQTVLDTLATDRLNFNDMQKKWVEKFYDTNEKMFNRWNQVLAEQGLTAVDRRVGHVPSIFKGAYKALVTNDKGATGVISVDSKYQLAAAKKYFAEKHPDYTVTDQGRKGLADYKSQSDIFSGMNDVIDMLAEKDPRFKEIQDVVHDAINHGNNSIYAFNKHELAKKGVIGNEGNKPWLDANKNTDAWFKSMVQYFEEGALHHELQGPLNDINKLMTDPELKMPKTKEYLDSYVKHVTGKNSNNWVATGLNGLIDLGPKLAGFGPRATLQLAGQIKNNMSQLFMGWGNYAFAGAQLLQPLQTGLPFMQLAAERMGSPAYATVAMFKGGTAFLLAGTERMTGKKLDSLSPDMRQAFKYAEDRGMMNFSEMERAYDGNKSKLGRLKDKVAEANMQVGELGTRAPMFMSYVDMLRHSDVPMERALPMAENMTQLSMIDYHQWERPQMYSKLGVMGQFAGGLTTFKHGFVGQQGKLLKEVGNGHIAPVGLSVAAAIAFAGITGLPFYDELDNIYGELTDKFGGKRSNIRDGVMSNLPEWSKSGMIANATGIAVNSKFSSANMIPDSIPKAASPQLEAFAKIVGDTYDVAKNGDKQSWSNLALDTAPSTFKGKVEKELFRDPTNGNLLDRKQMAKLHRTPEEWDLRAATGMRSTNEMLKGESDYRARTAEMADTARKKDIATDFERKSINNTMTPKTAQEMAKEYSDRGGDPKSLMNIFQKAAIERKATEEQRRNMGLKSNQQSVRKMEFYNKPGER